MKPRKYDRDWSARALEYAPTFIGMLAAGATLGGLATWGIWQATGSSIWLKWFFRYPNAALTGGFSLAAFVFSYRSVREFTPGERLQAGWLWLTCASFVHLAGRMLSAAGTAVENDQIRELGSILAGPVQTILLIAGLGHIARTFIQLGFKPQLRWADRIAITLVAGITLRTCYGIFRYLSDGKPVTWQIAVDWVSDPALLFLVIIAIYLGRAASSMGMGLVANCWRAFVATTVLTSVGDASLWCVQCTVSQKWTTLSWFVWLLADAAYALGPAFQVAALARIQSRSRAFEQLARYFGQPDLLGWTKSASS